MPAVNLICPACQKTGRVLRAVGAVVKVKCACGTTMERAAAAASARIVEVLDNGLMTKSVERLADAERLFKERIEQDKKARG